MTINDYDEKHIEMKNLILALALALALGTLPTFAKNVVIDVRTPQEYAGGHIAGALNIDHAVIAQEISKANVAKDDTVILYCRSGNRSGIAQETLKKMGYLKVQNYGSMDQARKLLSSP
ncbi:MAG: rhodanese-like domain-containing protein [Polaromonas sp.]|nr:rhodanese-like domain-containing protein [Polaromonas sp.]